MGPRRTLRRRIGRRAGEIVLEIIRGSGLAAGRIIDVGFELIIRESATAPRVLISSDAVREEFDMARTSIASVLA